MSQSVVTSDAPPSFVGPVLEPGAGVFALSSGGPASFGAQTLTTLSRLPASSISQYFAARPAAVEQILAAQPPAQEVALWWGDLDAERRTSLELVAPRLVGNLEGVPYTIRDTSNRTMLSQTISDLTTVMNSDAGRAVQQSAHQQLNMLSSISESLTADAANPERTLVTLDVSGQGRAAIVLGDLNEADYVSFLVPGMFFTIEGQMSYWVDAANELYCQQQIWLDRIESESPFVHNESVATVAWIGYDTPNLTNVGAIDNADQGRDTLAAAILGLQAERGNDQPYISIVAHSYGTTAAMMALSEYDFEIDALALVGSPGSPAESVADLHVRDGNVFVGEAAWDPIPNSSYFGPDPGAASFGAKSLSVSGGVDIITGQPLAASVGHNEYFTPAAKQCETSRCCALAEVISSSLKVPPPSIAHFRWHRTEKADGQTTSPASSASIDLVRARS
ncbi:alpha/beta hydrolase [Salinibacterium sp. PAMC 21357]|uniref:alpha/beta hydrolase n=1 Tax=Salinibacterium sp. PAMC 21357 TaxID=1112215 RepID=UPI00114769D4|nr:alpha/beta hydrolase [Salinibacterium sp. PAMC 21357]